MAALGDGINVKVDRKIYASVGDRDEQLVLRDVNFNVEPRSFVILTGPSGCGKSTLLNIIAGLDRDYEGAVDLGHGADRMAFIFQTPRLLPWRTVRENIELVLPDGDTRHSKIDDMLARVGLTHAANAYPEHLSLGMQRRAALARGFILEPEILLMDEPFVSLDDPTAQSLRELLSELWNGQPTTVIFVTHDRMEATMLGTRILRMSPGSATIMQDEPVKLSAGERRDRMAVQREQNRIFANA